MSTCYVDGTLTTGNNDGTDWTNAYQGSDGLISAIEVDMANIIYVKNTFTFTAGMELYIMHKNKIIGCDASGNILPVGSYVTFIANNVDNLFYNIEGGGINASFCNINFVGCTTIFYSDLGYDNLLFFNCKFSASVDFIIGEYSSNNNIIYEYCALGTNAELFGLNQTSISILNSVLYGRTGHIFEYTPIHYFNIKNSIFIGGSFLFSDKLVGNGCNLVLLFNNIFYMQEDYVFGSLGDTNRIIAYNNVFYKPGAMLSAAFRASGTLLDEDYNACYGAQSSSGLTGVHNVYGTDNLTFKFVNAANSDFRLKVDSLLLNAGNPLFAEIAFADGRSGNIGVYQNLYVPPIYPNLIGSEVSVLNEQISANVESDYHICTIENSNELLLEILRS